MMMKNCGNAASDGSRPTIADEPIENPGRAHEDLRPDPDLVRHPSTLSNHVQQVPLPIDLTDLFDVDGWGTFLQAHVNIAGASHNLILMAVRDDEAGRQVAADPGDDVEYARLQAFGDVRYSTIRIPGHDGEYIAYMLPGEAGE